MNEGGLFVLVITNPQSFSDLVVPHGGDDVVSASRDFHVQR